MRLTEGVWAGREGVQLQSAVEVASVSELPQGGVRALCATRHVRHRGDTLNKPTITVELTSPAPGIIGVSARHFAGKPPLKEPRAVLFPDVAAPKDAAPSTHIDADYARLTTAGNVASATLHRAANGFRVKFADSNGRKLTELGQESLQWALLTNASPAIAEREHATTTIADPYYRAPASQRRGYMVASPSLSVGEKVYGLGERFGPFVKNGQTVELSNEDGGTSSAVAYKNIPFYITNKGYGVYIDHLDHVSVEVQSDKMTRVQASVPGETIRFYIIAGATPKEILARYTHLTGHSPPVPDWSWGLWLSTSFLTSYDEKTVQSFLDGMRERDCPVSVLHFDCFWMKAHCWCDFQFDPEFFPDPKAFLARIHEQGIKVCVWINPFISQESRLFAEGDEKGYFIKRRDGSTFQSNDWQAGIATVDFTNPAATKWYQGYLEQLMDLGVDSFKTDFGERIVCEDVVYHDGSNPRTMHNAYTGLYNTAVYDVMVRKRGVVEACLFARSATVGGQRLPVHWGGDVDTEWTGLAETLRGGLSLGLSGFGYFSHDIGGFKAEGKAGGDLAQTPAAAIYKRWVQFGLLSSHSRLHGSASYRVPWLIDDEASLVLSKFTHFKHRLAPYLMTSMFTEIPQGTPLMRPLFLEFPEDWSAWNVDTQYLFGRDLLVCPVFDESRVSYYVPAGKWTNVFDGTTHTGPTYVQDEEHSMLSMPVLLRPGSALVLGRKGHGLADDLRKRGFVVVVAKASLADAAKPVRSETQFRDGARLIVEVDQSGKAQVLEPKGFSAPVEVVILEDGRGLDSA